MTTNKYHVSLIRGRVTVSYGSSYQILSDE